MALQHILMFPAIDGAPVRLVGQTASAQRAHRAAGLAAHIEDVPLAARIVLVPTHRPQQCLRRTAIGIGIGVVAERLEAEPPLRRQPPVALRRRDIGGDAVRLAVLQCLAIVIAAVGPHRQRLDPQRLLRRVGHRMQLAGVVAVVDHLARDDQLVLRIDRHLHIVACHRLAALGQQPRIGIGPRQLRLAAPPSVAPDQPAPPPASPSAPQASASPRRQTARPRPSPPRRSPPAPWHRPRYPAPVRRPARPAACASRCSPCSHRRGRTPRRSPPHIAAQQLQLMQHQHEVPVRRLQRRCVVLAEVADPGSRIAGPQVLQQPHHLNVARRLARQPARGTHLVQVAIQGTVSAGRPGHMAAGPRHRPDRHGGNPAPQGRACSRRPRSREPGCPARRNPRSAAAAGCPGRGMHQF